MPLGDKESADNKLQKGLVIKWFKSYNKYFDGRWFYFKMTSLKTA